MRAELKRLHRQFGMTIVYATPDELEALSMGEEIAVMRDGRVVQQGTPDDLYERPVDLYVATKIGSPHMNIIDVKVGDDGGSLETPFGRLGRPHLAAPVAAGEPLLLGVRPSDIRARQRLVRLERTDRPAARALGDVTIVSLLAGNQPLRIVLPEAQAVASSRATGFRSSSIRRSSTCSVVTTGRRSADNRGAKMRAPWEERKMKLHASIMGGLAAAALIAAAGMASGPATAEDVTLKMAVPDWPPTHIMKDLFDKNYKPKSGNTVKLDIDFIPWPDYYTRLNASLTSGEKKYNMAVSDSQWLGAFIEGGYYLNINKYVDADPGLQAVFKDLHPAVKDSYSTYPYKSDKLYGFPQMPDLVVNYYRKDVFCDPTEQKNFSDNTSTSCPARPRRWTRSPGTIIATSASSSSARRATC